LPEFDGKKFQNVAKEGLEFGDETKAEKEATEKLVEDYEPLTKYLGDKLGDAIEKATVSTRLDSSPCALVANAYGWSGNMERIMKAQAYNQNDNQNDHYEKQKKILEINPRHPLIKNLLSRVQESAPMEDGEEKDAFESTTVDMAAVLVDTARLRSGYQLKDQVGFSQRIEKMLRLGLGVDLTEEVESEPEYAPDVEEEEEEEGEEDEEEDAEGDADDAAADEGEEPVTAKEEL